MTKLDRYIQRLRIKQVIPYIDPNVRLLDVGCADGALYSHVPMVREYVGIDPEAPVQSSTAKARFIRSSFPSGSLTSEDTFDVITALAILEHIRDDRQVDFAAACAQHLRPGGILAITVPSPVVDHILALLKWLHLVHGMHEEQHYGYRPADTTALFTSHGLVLERQTKFELGLNHFFVFRKPAAAGVVI